MFQHYCVSLRELVVSTLPSYTSKSNALVGDIIENIKLYYQLMHLAYLCNLARY